MLSKTLASLLLTFGIVASSFGTTCPEAEQFRVSLKESIESATQDRVGNVKYYETLLNEELKKCGLEPAPEIWRKVEAAESVLVVKSKLQKQRAMDDAVAQARFRCKNRTECEKVFSLTQIFIVSNSDTKIQLANDTVIETFNATESLSLSLKALKLPRAGTSADVILQVNCQHDQTPSKIDLCASKSIDVYKKYPPFVRANLIN